MRKRKPILLTVLGAVATAGCVNVRAPDVNVDAGRPPPPVSPREEPKTYEEAVAAWRAALERNAYLEHKVADLEEDKRELKRERDKYKDRYKRLKDKYDD